MQARNPLPQSLHTGLLPANLIRLTGITLLDSLSSTPVRLLEWLTLCQDPGQFTVYGIISTSAFKVRFILAVYR